MIYGVKFTLQPTAAMTFRILPGSILNIATYPFVPPTTFSGYLRRLMMISRGLELPETQINKNNPPIYALPPQYLALGAYPTDSARGIHRTYRKGMREFNHDSFSKLYQDKDKANFQLHSWEYLITDQLLGYVVADSAESLEPFQQLQSYGCKLGKEGFAIVDQVSDIVSLQQQTLAASPSAIAPIEALLETNPFIGGCDIYNLYRYNWKTSDQFQFDQPELWMSLPSSIEGFVPWIAAYFPHDGGELPTLNYYTNGVDIYLPVSLINLLRGDVHV